METAQIQSVALFSQWFLAMAPQKPSGRSKARSINVSYKLMRPYGLPATGIASIHVVAVAECLFVHSYLWKGWAPLCLSGSHTPECSYFLVFESYKDSASNLSVSSVPLSSGHSLRLRPLSCYFDLCGRDSEFWVPIFNYLE